MPILETVGPLPSQPHSRKIAATTGESAVVRKHGRLPKPSLEWNAEVERDTAHLYARIKNVVPSIEWPCFAPYVRAINAVKKERNRLRVTMNQPWRPCP